MTSKLTREENVQAVFDLKAGYTLGLADVEILKRVARMALAAMDSEPNRNPVLAYADSYRDMEKQGVESVPIWSVITDLERNIAPLYRHAQPAPELKPVGYLFVSDQGAIVYSPTDWGMPGFRLVGQIYGDIDVESQPAPVVPDELNTRTANDVMNEHLSWKDYGDAEVFCIAWNACRAAMLQGAKNSESRVGIQTAPALDSFKKNAESRCGNAPVIPEGWTGNDKANAALMMLDRIETIDSVDDDRIDGIKRIVRELAAATTGIPIISDTWIPVGERMPEDEQEVLTRNRMGHRFVSFFDKHSGLFFDRIDAPAACCIEHVLVTHWMPLPAGPQEVK